MNSTMDNSTWVCFASFVAEFSPNLLYRCTRALFKINTFGKQRIETYKYAGLEGERKATFETIMQIPTSRNLFFWQNGLKMYSILSISGVMIYTGSR